MSPTIASIMKFTRLRRAGHVAMMEEKVGINRFGNLLANKH